MKISFENLVDLFKLSADLTYTNGAFEATIEYVTRPWCIYLLRDPRTNAPRYVGWTVNLRQRLRDHLKDTEIAKRTYKCNWLRGLKDAELSPLYEVLERGEGDGWADAERRWIAYFRSNGAYLTNNTDGGEGTPGWHPSEETRLEWSRKRKGRKPHPNSVARTIELTKGKPRPLSVLQPMWDANRMTPKSASHREAISRARIGMKLNLSDEQRRKNKEHLAAIRLLAISPEAMEKKKEKFKQQAASRSSRAKRWWEEMRKDPERLADYLARRGKTLSRVLLAKKRQNTE